MTRRWYEVLVPPYQTEKTIVAVLLPMDWTFGETETKDEKHKLMVACSADKSRWVGLQFFDPNLKRYEDHRKRFMEYGLKCPDAAYIGPISTLPTRLLLDETLTCLIFCRDEYWRRPLDLKRIWKPKPEGEKC